MKDKSKQYVALNNKMVYLQNHQRMNKTVILLLLLVFTVCFKVHAQEPIELKGQVLNDTISKSQLTVVNITRKQGTITNRDGEFTILARVNDTINVSAVQYESRQFVVNQTIYNREKISLYLIPKVTQLDEVNISNIDLTGDIKKDVGSTKLQRIVTPKELGIPENTAPERTIEERRYYTAVTSGAGIPLDGLINSITGRLKMLKKHIEVSRFAKKIEDTRYQYSDSIYMSKLKIPEDLIEDFVYYIFEDPEAKKYADTNDALGLLEFMMKKSTVYKELREKEKQ